MIQCKKLECEKVHCCVECDIGKEDCNFRCQVPELLLDDKELIAGKCPCAEIEADD